MTARHLTVEEFAEREGVPVQTVYGWNSRGLAPRRLVIGKYVRYRLEDVIEWENARAIDDLQRAAG